MKMMAHFIPTSTRVDYEYTSSAIVELRVSRSYFRLKLIDLNLTFLLL